MQKCLTFTVYNMGSGVFEYRSSLNGNNRRVCATKTKIKIASVVVRSRSTDATTAIITLLRGCERTRIQTVEPWPENHYHVVPQIFLPGATSARYLYYLRSTKNVGWPNEDFRHLIISDGRLIMYLVLNVFFFLNISSLITVVKWKR